MTAAFAAGSSGAFVSIPVGLSRTLEQVFDAHTAPQRRFVEQIVNSPTFAFACDNPFTLEQKRFSYRGPFWFLWYDTADRLHAVKVGVLGRSLGPEIVVPNASPAPERSDLSDRITF